MRVLDQEPWCWTLGQDGDELVFDVNCSHSAVSYSFLIALDAAETAHFRDEGRAYLTKLAEGIQMSAPGVRGNASPYLNRRLSAQRDEAFTEAVKAWRAGFSAQ
jgi:hypothetical protein